MVSLPIENSYDYGGWCCSCSDIIDCLHAAFRHPNFPSDPGRIVAQVVSGVGFLGAGAIIRFGVTVKG